MKHLLSLTLVMLLLFGLLVGCGDEETPNTAPTSNIKATESTTTTTEDKGPTVTEDETTETEDEEDETTTTEDEEDETTTTEDEEDETTTTEDEEDETTTNKSEDNKTTTTRRSRSTGSKVSTTAEKPTTTTKAPETAIDGLANTKYLLTQKKKLTVGYIGGSITNGTGAGESEKLRDKNSWRGLTNTWLRETYPDAEITDINAAVGATGSYYAKNRIDYDLLDKKPDLVFIEFVVNDQIEGRSMLDSRANMETMVRKCLQSNPNMDIVFVYTTTVDYGSKTNPPKQAFNFVAAHYGIEVIDAGLPLTKNEKPIEKLFTYDKVHPNPAGYKVMFEEIEKNLTEMLADAGNPTTLKKHTMPATITEGLNINTKTYRAADIKEQNPALTVSPAQKDWVPHEHIEMKKGDTLTFTFKGDSVGMFFYCTDTEWTNVQVKLDDGQTYSRRLYIRANTIIDEVFTNLDKNEKHTITLTFEGEKELLIPFIFTTI